MYESLEPGENLINDKHLSRIIELKMKAGTLSSDVSSKKTLEEKCDLYKNTIFLEKIKTEIKRLLGDKTEPEFINNKVSALEPLVKNKLIQTVSSKTWEEFNVRVEAAQAALVRDVRDTFKSKSPMANDTWHKCRAILKQADIARAGCSSLIEERKAFEKLEQQSTASSGVEKIKAVGKSINAAITPLTRRLVGPTLEEAINKTNELRQQWERAQQRVENLIKVISKLSGKEETPDDIKQRVSLEKELESLMKEASDSQTKYIKAFMYAGQKSQSKKLTPETSESETESETYEPPEMDLRTTLKTIRDENADEKTKGSNPSSSV